tara:strand:- start:5288 stop:5419 length:132 start_codon:yes stop_codon:yes gene_type:complete
LFDSAGDKAKERNRIKETIKPAYNPFKGVIYIILSFFNHKIKK